MNITDEAVKALAAVLVEDGAYGVPWGDASGDDRAGALNKARRYLTIAAPHMLAGSMRETATEWAAAFPQTGNVYNYHRTQEEAQAFVDGMREVGADMVVMTREVLPQDASDWRPTP